MKPIDYDSLTLDQLRQYVLSNREDNEAFYRYIDRSKTEGRMISVDLAAPDWEERITREIIERGKRDRI